jgi:hypothetical protein
MALHLMKLCVGVEGVEELEAWVKDCKAGRDSLDHVTRSSPKRADEILPHGSLYWVIKGAMLCRQPIERFAPVRGEDGIERCRIVFKPKIVIVRPAPRRAFQGWRYLEGDDVPPDMPRTSGSGNLSGQMRRDLAELGLL